MPFGKVLVSMGSRDSTFTDFSSVLGGLESGGTQHFPAFAYRKGRAMSDLNKSRVLFRTPNSAKSDAVRRIVSVDANGKSVYKEDTLMGLIVHSSYYTYVSFLLVFANTLWVSFELDIAQEDRTLGHWLWSVDSLFCILFILELLPRWFSLKKRYFLCKDKWLLFDNIMVVMSAIEAWVVPVMAGQELNDGSHGPLRMLRFLRLTRIARTLTIFRLMPELAVLLRGISRALRAVLAVVLLLAIFVYANAVYFTALSKDMGMGEEYFPNVPSSMKTLLVHGILLDSPSHLINVLGRESPFLGVLFVVFIFVTAFLLLNMLVGVLVDVVTVTASVEQEESLGQFVRDALEMALENIGHDGRKRITRGQMERVVRQGVMNEVYRELEISMNTSTLMQFIFMRDGEAADFVHSKDVVLTLLQLRASSPATVRDVLETRRTISHRLGQVEAALRDLASSPRKKPTRGRASLKSCNSSFGKERASSVPNGNRLSFDEPEAVSSGGERIQVLHPNHSDSFGSKPESKGDSFGLELYREVTQATVRLREFEEKLINELVSQPEVRAEDGKLGADESTVAVRPRTSFDRRISCDGLLARLQEVSRYIEHAIAEPPDIALRKGVQQVTGGTTEVRFSNNKIPMATEQKSSLTDFPSHSSLGLERGLPPEGIKIISADASNDAKHASSESWSPWWSFDPLTRGGKENTKIVVSRV